MRALEGRSTVLVALRRVLLHKQLSAYSVHP